MYVYVYVFGRVDLRGAVLTDHTVLALLYESPLMHILQVSE